MFTGLVCGQAEVVDIYTESGFMRFAMQPTAVLADVKIGDSIAINGACLTVVRIEENVFYFECMQETLQKTALAALQVGTKVNYELALLANARLAGHVVQAHVDTVATVASIQAEGPALRIGFNCADDYVRQLVPKGFITIDGMSLTIAQVEQDGFSIAFIPHTIKATIVQYYQVGTRVNMEIDILTKTCRALMQAGAVHVSAE